MEGHIQHLSRLQGLGIRDPVQLHQYVLLRPELRSNLLQRAPGGHDMRQVHRLLPAHGVAAARQGYPELLPGGDHVRVGHVVGGGDLLVGDELEEDVPGDEVEAGVGGADGVDGGAVGGPGGGAAGAGEGDAEGGVGVEEVGGWGGEREVVRAEEGREGGDVEEGLEGGEGGGVGGEVARQGLAFGRLAGAGEGNGLRCGDEDEDKDEE